MSGISVVYSQHSIDETLVKNMNKLIEHRGPNGEGIESFENNQLWFGHRKLKIIESTSNEQQPMSYSNNRYWITYNGQIYNYVELKKELINLGYSFKSETDTEVILASYAEWGSECLNRFNGMWSFVIYDRKNNILFGSRDRFGIKPLYYWKNDNGLIAFASEIKQFTVLPKWKAIMNHQRVYDFLNWGISDHTSETMFKGVYQIRGGEAFQINLKEELKFEIYKWYEPNQKNYEGTFEEAVIKFKSLFEDSIKLRFGNDIEVGSLLSGGLDSSSIVCMVDDLLNKENRGTIHNTFSVCSHEKKYDEREFIEYVLDNRKIKPHFIYPELDYLFNILDDITWYQDEPFGSTSIFAQWNAFRLAAEHNIKVMFDGQGADEILAGYHTFFAPHFAGLFKKGKLIKLVREIKKTQELHGYNSKHAIVQITNMLAPEILRQQLKKVYGKSNISPNWINFDKLQIVKQDPTFQYGFKSHAVKDLSYSQVFYTNLPKLLHWEDRDSMAHSIESRLPFLDYRLVEFLLSLPDEYKLNEGITKRILRESMQGILPEKVRMRMDKLGFATPEEVWVRKQRPEIFLSHIKQAINDSNGFINEEIYNKAERIIKGQEQFSFLIWRIISFGRWIKKYNVDIQ